MTISTRTQKALKVLEEGGFFRNALETNSYTRREQFQTRLYNKDRKVVKGFGFKAHLELEQAGMLIIRDTPSGSTWRTEYVLRDKALTAA